MEEFEIKPAASREELVRYGTAAAAYIAGGFLLVIIVVSIRHPLLGIILPGIAFSIGLRALISSSRDDKKPGFVLTAAGVLDLLAKPAAAAGALGLLSRFILPMKYIAPFILGIGALLFFAAGIWNGINFFIGLKSRQ